MDVRLFSKEWEFILQDVIEHVSRFKIAVCKVSDSSTLLRYVRS